jgi:hypothetical protein
MNARCATVGPAIGCLISARTWHDQARFGAGCWLSLLRSVVDRRAVVDVENVDNAAVLVDPVDDAIGAAQGAVTTGERPEQRLADPLRVDRKRGIAELQYNGSSGFRKPLGNRSPCGWLEPDLVPPRLGQSPPVGAHADRAGLGASPAAV